MTAIAFPLEQQLTRTETPFVPPGSKVTLPAVVSLSGIPFIMAPTGTVTGAGVLTFGTAVAGTYASCYVYVPAGVAFPGAPAGWFYAVMTSATVGTLYQTQYTSGPVQQPANPVPAVGNGAYTGVTTAQSGPQITIPANLMQPNSMLRLTTLWSANSSTNNKTIGATLGGSTVTSIVLTGTPGNSGAKLITEIWARGSQNAQVAIATGQSGDGTYAGPNDFMTVNMGAAQVLALTLQDATATDWTVLEAYVIELLNTSNIATD